MIKKYYILSGIAMPAIVTALLLGFLVLILELIDDFVFENYTNSWVSMELYMGLAIVLMCIFAYGMLAPFLGMRSKRWKK